MKKLLAFIVCVAMAAIFASVAAVSAATVDRELIRDEFVGELSANNWRMQEGESPEDQKVYMESAESLLSISSATPFAFAYYDEPVEVSDTEDLVIEWDYIDWSGGNDYSIFAIMKGLAKTDGVMDFNDNAAAESVYSYLNLVGQSAAALNVILGSTEHGPDADAMPEAGTSYRESPSWGYNFQKTDGSGDQGWTPGFETKGYRYRQIYKADGTLEGYSAPINEDGSVGEYTMHMLTKPGAIRYRSGYIGIYLQADVRAEILIDNFKAGTRASGASEIVYEIEDDFSDAEAIDQKWQDYNGTADADIALVSSQSAASYLVFDNSAEDNYLTSAPRTAVEYNDRYDNYAELSFDMQILNLEEGRTFGILFGLNGTGDGVGVSGLSFFHITREGDKYFANYSLTTETGYEVKEKTELTETFAESVKVSLKGLVGGKAEFTVGDQMVSFGAETPVKLELRFALALKGDNTAANAKVIVDNVVMSAKSTVVSEDAKSVSMNFEGTDKDGNPWYNPEDWRLYSVSTGLAGGVGFQGVEIKEGALHFVNAGHNSMFATQRQYANFEFQFDVVDMQRTVEVNEAGTVTKPVMNSPILICIGMPAGGYYLQSSYIEIGSPLNKTINDADFDKATANLELKSAVGGQMQITKNIGLRHNLIDPALDGRTIRFRVVVMDGTVKLYYCVLGEEDMQEMLYNNTVFEGKVDSPLGQVGVSVTGGSYSIGGNMIIDNMYVRDLDADSVIPVENAPEESAEEPGTPGDEDPTTPPDGGADSGEESGCNGCSGKVGAAEAAAAGIAIGAAGIFLCLKRVLRRKD